ncbi:MAG: hypothetical protein JBO36_20440 [Candidatus Thiodiazotropha taylori]|nr:hypothetical protein [Candidatus Thiodiazotropha taylori]
MARCTPDTLMDHAPGTIREYLDACVEMIDGKLGKGYSKAHPELLASLVNACVQDFHSGMVNNCVDDIAICLNAFENLLERFFNEKDL